MQNDRIFMTKANKGEHVLCNNRTLCDVRSLCKRFRNSAFVHQSCSCVRLLQRQSLLSQSTLLSRFTCIYFTPKVYRGRARPILGGVSAPCAARARSKDSISCQIYMQRTRFPKKIGKKRQNTVKTDQKLPKIAKIDRNFTENAKSWRFYRKI